MKKLDRVMLAVFLGGLGVLCAGYGLVEAFPELAPSLDSDSGALQKLVLTVQTVGLLICMGVFPYYMYHRNWFLYGKEDSSGEAP